MLKRFFVLIIFLLTLSGCSYIKKHHLVGDQADVYQKADETPPFKVPPVLTHNILGSKTELLPAQIKAEALPAIPAPPGSLVEQKG